MKVRARASLENQKEYWNIRASSLLKMSSRISVPLLNLFQWLYIDVNLFFFKKERMWHFYRFNSS